jgi:3-oxoacyl-(acyl-carrier-protein) synthase
MTKRIVVTGMSINTPIGDNLNAFYDNLVSGRSAISRWRFFDDDRVYSKVGGDLSDYDWAAKVQSLEAKLPEDVAANFRKIARKAPFSTRLGLLAAVDAWIDAGLGFDMPEGRQGVIVGGHNLNENYLLSNHAIFLQEDPDYIDSQAALLMLDTDHAGTVGDVLGCKGTIFTIGGACASANLGLRSAIDEIRYHDHDVIALVGSPLDYSPMGLHAMGLMGAITIHGFNDAPEKASRPYDTSREGFVPSHGAATLILESYDHAKARGARMYAEVLGCVALSDGSHLPTPSPIGQARTLRKLFETTGVKPEQIDMVSAHATSTAQGDISELTAIKEVFGAHAKKLALNAPKSMLGHTCWSAPAVETVAAIMQMRHGVMHPSINIEELDPEVDLDVCANEPKKKDIGLLVKNSFGFGGINCCALWRNLEADV